MWLNLKEKNKLLLLIKYSFSSTLKCGEEGYWTWPKKKKKQDKLLKKLQFKIQLITLYFIINFL